MPIENIILDIGNVICRWNPEGLMRGVFDSNADIANAHKATVGHPDWLELDRGTIALAEAINNAQNRTDLDPDKIAQIYDNTAPSLVPVEATVAKIRELHSRGVPLYVLSNMHTHCWQYLSDNYDFWSCFNGLVISSDIKLIKPDPAIYQYTLDQYALDPAVTAFIDDLEVNINAANSAGIQGVVLSDPDDGVATIDKLLAS